MAGPLSLFIRTRFEVKAGMDYERRLLALRQKMAEEGCDLAIFGGCPNYQYLTGDLSDWRQAPDHRQGGGDLFVFAEGAPVIGCQRPPSWNGTSSVAFADIERGISYGDWVSSLIRSSKPKKIGIGANLGQATHLALHSCNGTEIVDASHWLDEVRAIKEPEEVERMRAVAKLTDDAMLTVVKGLSDGMSMNDVALEIEMQGRRLGASGVSFGPFSGFMRLGAGQPDDIVNMPTTEGLRANTAICFDVGFVLDGYASDWGRSVYWGKCPSHISDAYKALVDSMIATVSLLHDGSMRACDVYPAVEKELDKRGFGEPMRRRLAEHKVMGHSIGVEVHEAPWLATTSQAPLREGMTIAIEPKLWVPGEYYLRLEEIVLVGKRSSEFLTNFDRSLFQL